MPRPTEAGGHFSEKLREVGTHLGMLANAFHQLEAAYESELLWPSASREIPYEEAAQPPTLSRSVGLWPEKTEAPPSQARLWYDPLAPAATEQEIPHRYSKAEGDVEEEEEPMEFLSALVKGSTTDRTTSRSSKYEGEGQVPSKFLSALINGSSTEHVAELLSQSADPNEEFSRFYCVGRDFSSGTPLCVATLRRDKALLRTLLAHAADPLASEYSFVAGAEQMLWSGPAIHAALPHGYFDMLELLVGAKADIHAKGSNGANLVWQAAYFGHRNILEHLLRQNVDFAEAAMSQDDRTLSYTPLHVAAFTGHAGAVEALLVANAEHDVQDGRGHSPLDDAVAQGHASVCKHLVAHGADLFRRRPPLDGDLMSDRHSGMSMFCWGEGSDAGQGELRCLDHVFQSDNPFLLSAVAQGLCRARELLSDLSTDDLIRFLRAGGHTPVHILQAIFQPHQVRYWEDKGERRFRRTKTAAFLDIHRGVNIAEGPHFRVLQNHFNCRRTLPQYAVDFVETLMPTTSAVGSGMMHVPVIAYMSHIPWLHRDLKVLLAIADCETSKIFKDAGCQAIISVLWGSYALLARFRMLIAFLEVLNLVFINVTLHLSKRDGSSERATVLGSANTLAAVVWVVTFLFELAQAVGYVSSSLMRRYLATPRYWFDLVALAMTGVVIFEIWQLGLNASDSELFSTILGVLVFLKWMGFLIYLRQIRSVGVRILPITTTMFDVGPFCLVLCVYLMGSVNMYYALGVQTLEDSAMSIFRLVVLGDVDLFELEGIFPTQMSLVDDGNRIEQVLSPRTEYYWAVRGMVVTVSFIVGVLMMNLFVAILCLSYSRAAEEARLSLMRSRANIVLDQHAIRVGMETVMCVTCKKRMSVKPPSPVERKRRSTLSIEATTSTSLADQLEEAKSAYIWYARPADIDK